MTVSDARRSGAGAGEPVGRTGLTVLDEVFTTARAESRAALIAYLPAGYPTVAGSTGAAHPGPRRRRGPRRGRPALLRPGARRPGIQRAVDAALRGGVRMRDTLSVVEAGRRAGRPRGRHDLLEPGLRYGADAFAAGPRRRRGPRAPSPPT